MQKRTCGDSGLELSVLGLGCWEFGGGEYWGHSNQDDVDAVVKKAVESGINYFDTAEVYNEGRSEISLGLALRPFRRETVVIGSKISPSNCYPGEITRHCDASLARLGSDYLDVYMLHWPVNQHSLRHFTNDVARISRPPVLAEALMEFSELKKAGKIRHFGVSNFGAERLAELAALGGIRPAVNELPYNLLSRAVEFAGIDACRKARTGIIGYMTLLQGVLGKAMANIDELAPQLRRTRHFDSHRNSMARHGENGAEKTLRKTLAELYRLAENLACPLPELAIRWVAANPAISCALVGVRSPERLAGNVRAVASPLSAEIVDELNRITEPLKQELGPSLDYYESLANNRT